MNFRLKTNGVTAEILKKLQSSTGLTPNLLARISISLSVIEKSLPPEIQSESNGLEFNRNTLTGDQDYFYKSLIVQQANKEISEEEYFPHLFNCHLARGAKLLDNEYQHAGNYDKLLTNLITLSNDNLKEV